MPQDEAAGLRAWAVGVYDAFYRELGALLETSQHYAQTGIEPPLWGRQRAQVRARMRQARHVQRMEDRYGGGRPPPRD